MDTHQACSSAKSKKEAQQEIMQIMRNSGRDIVEPGTFASKYALSAPYHIFFTRVEESRETYSQNFSITFPEILDRSFGEIVNSLHLNCKVDVKWLHEQYVLADQCTDMMILCGNRVDEEEIDNIIVKHVDMPSEFGKHHTKMMILQYKDNRIKIVISTANLHFDDWENRTQGLWISPHLPPLPTSAKSTDGDSPTNFKRDFLQYLNKYQGSDWDFLKQWVKVVEKANFSAINVFLLTSTPGSYTNIEANLWGYKKLERLLSWHVTLPPDASQWPIIAQSSSVGSFGKQYDNWLLKVIKSMSCDTTQDLRDQPEFQFIYPSVDNYEKSFDFRNSTCCLCYSMEVYSKQPWLESYLYQWKATRTGRDKAMPHVKSYTRVSPDLKSIPWFVLTSANLSKGAWGCQWNKYYITRNYEVGVVFLPKFVTGTMMFTISEDKGSDIPIFPIPYDLPLCKYDSSDDPFITREE
ncbi:PREDICTED: probable tyrosyl-DNA phosphodiesterase [Dinoponera quadriceps]|uniref:Probable tyrosyl-DNA phosphodiesterase n=1 Tax=Dinoponera quadriceps TaxID=609295 RepID=A0A6P3XBM8_DINQU|nr:PREDICTED: probable tyrosyl-DNA phosphodiesterase [Dinoponera quadriceps]